MPIRLVLRLLILSPVSPTCAVDVPHKIDDLYNCGVSEEGYQLFRDAGQRQRELAAIVTEVPIVALNELFLKDEHVKM
ncbi:hypothetical protein E2C01_101278 [Portunus trituberculatus]|uniref:Uncharacterized protein n=1 Tax=Portunus trituberculatus TaxID=210409 RepID=A0A5B7KEC6_PORTR|nr:hypothetical protein [Portunus trituberculatus]